VVASSVHGGMTCANSGVRVACARDDNHVHLVTHADGDDPLGGLVGRDVLVSVYPGFRSVLRRCILGGVVINRCVSATKCNFPPERLTNHDSSCAAPLGCYNPSSREIPTSLDQFPAFSVEYKSLNPIPGPSVPIRSL